MATRHQPPVDPPDGLPQVEAYAHGAVTRNLERYGPLPTAVSREDVVQGVHLELLRALGPRYGEWIGRAREGRFEGSDEHRALLAAVQKALYDARGKEDQRNRRGAPKATRLEALEQALAAPPAAPLAVELADLAIDLDQGFCGLSEEEKTVWRLLTEGKTLGTIGAEIGRDFRRVAEIKKKLVQALAARLSC